MRPIILEMTAFGSYADHTTIHFDDFHNGLYLITGDTGAGKTTIFDGIMFALFGQASGMPSGGKSEKKQVGDFRSFEMMHSDFVSPFVPMEIVLEFEQDGHIHRVKRTCVSRKTRSGEVGDFKKEAFFWEYGKDVLEKQNMIDKRIVELIGMNADQFRKIVMLAQGEFDRFLGADSDEKQKILGDLFGDSQYAYYQNLLAGARKKLYEERMTYVDVISAALSSLEFGLDVQESDKALFLPEHTTLMDNLQDLLHKDQEKMVAAEVVRSGCQETVNALNMRIGTAEMCNRRLGQLKDLKEHYKAMKDQEEEIRREKEELQKVEKAVIHVLPVEEKTRETTENLKKARDRGKELAACETRSLAKVELCRETAKDDDRLQDQMRTLNLQIQKIRNCRKEYEELAEAKKRKSTSEMAMTAAAKEFDAAKTEMELLQIRSKQLREEEVRLSDSGERAARLCSAMKLLQDKEKGLTASGQLRDRIAEAVQREELLDVQANELVEKMQIALDKQNQYNQAYRCFIESQAAILAKEVEIELKRNGRADCPVCGSHLIRGKCHLAESHMISVDKKTLDRLKKAFDKAENDRISLENAHGKARSRFEGDCQIILRDLKTYCDEKTYKENDSLPKELSWEIIKTPSFMENLTSHYMKILNSATAEWEAAEADRSRLKHITAERMAAEEKIKVLTEKTEGCQSTLVQQTGVHAAAKQEIINISDRLEYPSWEEAESDCSKKQKLYVQLENTVSSHTRALQNANEELSSIRGQLSELNATLPELEDTCIHMEEMLDEALIKNGFDDISNVHLLLSGIRDEYHSWMRNMRAHINSYDNECATTLDSITNLEKETIDYHWTNLEQLQKEKNEAIEAYNRANVSFTNLASLQSNHTNVAKRVMAAKAQLDDTKEAWDLLKDLGAVAEGVSASDGKWNFNSYVMGAMFREVLHMANMRLNIISGGKYELIHEASGKVRVNSNASMEISVMDMTTGKSRRSSSLSGGEKFLTSLSLALGLSDVVQSRTGGITLDVLFIDEGFGTLDNDKLDKAIAVLNQLTEGKRQIGIISHVEKLEESIPQQLVVKKGDKGSYILRKI